MAASNMYSITNAIKCQWFPRFLNRKLHHFYHVSNTNFLCSISSRRPVRCNRPSWHTTRPAARLTVTQSQSPAATSKGSSGRLRAMNLPGTRRDSWDLALWNLPNPKIHVSLCPIPFFLKTSQKKVQKCHLPSNLPDHLIQTFIPPKISKNWCRLMPGLLAGLGARHLARNPTAGPWEKPKSATRSKMLRSKSSKALEKDLPTSTKPVPAKPVPTNSSEDENMHRKVFWLPNMPERSSCPVAFKQEDCDVKWASSSSFTPRWWLVFSPSCWGCTT